MKKNGILDQYLDPTQKPKADPHQDPGGKGKFFFHVSHDFKNLQKILIRKVDFSKK